MHSVLSAIQIPPVILFLLKLKFFVKLRFLQDGDYMISILARESDRITVAKFQLKSDLSQQSDGISVGMICFLTLLAVSGVAIFILYRRYKHVQKHHQVTNPKSSRVLEMKCFVRSFLNYQDFFFIVSYNCGKPIASKHC